MKKAIWSSGAPQSTGIYWYDPGYVGIDMNLFVCQVSSPGDVYLFGDYGCMPLDHVSKKAKHTSIQFSDKWTDVMSLGNHTRAWVKHPKGYIGLGLLRMDSHGPIGTIVWLTHINSASESGVWLRGDDGYLIAPIKEPKREL